MRRKMFTLEASDGVTQRSGRNPLRRASGITRTMEFGVLSSPLGVDEPAGAVRQQRAAEGSGQRTQQTQQPGRTAQASAGQPETGRRRTMGRFGRASYTGTAPQSRLQHRKRATAAIQASPFPPFHSPRPAERRQVLTVSFLFANLGSRTPASAHRQAPPPSFLGATPSERYDDSI